MPAVVPLGNAIKTKKAFSKHAAEEINNFI